MIMYETARAVTQLKSSGLLTISQSKMVINTTANLHQCVHFQSEHSLSYTVAVYLYMSLCVIVIDSRYSLLMGKKREDIFLRT